MNKILDWLKSKNINSHVIVAGIVTVAVALETDTKVRDFFIGSFDHHPKLVAGVFALTAIIFKYSHSSTPVPPK